jgi:cell division transport system permease protein
MKAILAHLRYFVVDAVDEWRHSPGANLLATATLAAVLFVAGVNVLILANLSANVDRWKNDLRISIYLDDGAAPAAVTALRDKLSAIPGVARVDSVDKAEALKRFRAAFPDLADIPAGLETNPLPASLEVVLTPGPASRGTAGAVEAAVRDDSAVETVRYDQAVLDRVDAILGIARWGGMGLGLVVFTAVAFVVAGVLRLTVYARRDEIEIMLLVGAAPWFVRGPFLVAGLAQGIGGGAFAVALVEVLRRVGIAYARPQAADLLRLVAGHALPPPLAGLLVAVGATLGFASAWFAVRRSSPAYQSNAM